MPQRRQVKEAVMYQICHCNKEVRVSSQKVMFYWSIIHEAYNDKTISLLNLVLLM